MQVQVQVPFPVPVGIPMYPDGTLWGSAVPQAAQAEHGEYEEGQGPGHLQIGGTLKRGRDHGERDEEPEEGEEEGRAWTRTRRSDSGDDVDAGVACLPL